MFDILKSDKNRNNGISRSSGNGQTTSLTELTTVGQDAELQRDATRYNIINQKPCIYVVYVAAGDPVWIWMRRTALAL